MKTEEVIETVNMILANSKDRPTGDIAGQIFYLTQAVCLLVKVTNDLAK